LRSGEERVGRLERETASLRMEIARMHEDFAVLFGAIRSAWRSAGQDRAQLEPELRTLTLYHFQAPF
jgi:hypothetical protein